MQLTFDLQQITHMVAMQDNMNSIVLGRDWVDAELHQKVDWVTAMSAEAGEFPDHLAFKWWKKQDVDLHQAKLELVDIYHFMISQIATIHFGKIAQISGLSEEHFPAASLKAAALHSTAATLHAGAMEFFYSSRAFVHIANFNKLDVDTRRKNVCSTLRRCVNRFDLMGLSEDMNEEDGKTLEQYLIDGVEQFTSVCEMVGLSPKELYMNYVGKNVLNRFRQENGYKDGTYVKIWNGLEDNQVLEKFINTQMKLDNVSPDADFEKAAHTYLTRHYPKSKAA